MVTTDSLPQPELKTPEDYLLPLSSIFRVCLIIAIALNLKHELNPVWTSSESPLVLCLTISVLFILPSIALIIGVALRKKRMEWFAIAHDVIAVAATVGFAASQVEAFRLSYPLGVQVLYDVLPSYRMIVLLLACEGLIFLRLKLKTARSLLVFSVTAGLALAVGHLVQVNTIRRFERVYAPMLNELRTQWIKLPENLTPSDVNINRKYCAAGFKDADSDAYVGFSAWKNQGRWQYEYLSIGDPQNPRYDRKWTRTIAQSELTIKLPNKSKLDYIGTKPATSNFGIQSFVFYCPKNQLYYEISSQGTRVSSAAKIVIDSRAIRSQSPPPTPKP